MAKLLPKTVGEFASDKYWETFFAQVEDQERESFEWYADYLSLQSTLDRYLKASDKILQIGCGNSLLADQLYDNGYRSITSIDIVAEVVKKQKQRNRKKRPELEFLVADVTQSLNFDPSSFNVVIDKGTLDALLPDDSEENLIRVKKMFSEIERCLANGGRYIIVSLAQEIVLKQWISYFTGRSLLRLHQLPFSSNTSKHAVFLLIATKLKDGMKIPEMYEILTPNSSSAKRCTDVEEIFASTKAIQQYRYFCHKATSPLLEEELEIQLYNDLENKPRYKVILVHKQEEPKLGTPFAVFVVPNGNENGWVYSTPKGRQELCKLANCRRLAVVSLVDNTAPITLNDIKAEMNAIILDFAPSYLKDMKNIPYLSVDADVDTISKKTLASYESPISGRFEIIDICYKDSERLRQLVFSSNKATIQSEIGIVNEKLDWGNLACLYHRAIVAALAISCEDFIETELKICLIGLGGGCLATFMRKHFPKASIIVVELDPVVVEAAKDWFEFHPDEKLSCVIEDGVEFLKRHSAECVVVKNEVENNSGENETNENSDKNDNGLIIDHSKLFDVIILDVAGPSVGEDGLTGPPPAFLTDECVRDIKRLLTPNGALALNLVTRDKQKAAKIKQEMSDIFETVLSHGITDMVNELLLCLPFKPDDFAAYNEQVQQRLTRLYEYLAEICSASHPINSCANASDNSNSSSNGHNEVPPPSPASGESDVKENSPEKCQDSPGTCQRSPENCQGGVETCQKSPEECQNVNEMLEKILRIK